jgi:hypothetical protein
MRGSELTQDWLDNDPTAMVEPIIIEEPDGLGMRMPPPTLTVPEIATTLGHETPLEVIGIFPWFIWLFQSYSDVLTLLRRRYAVQLIWMDTREVVKLLLD